MVLRSARELYVAARRAELRRNDPTLSYKKADREASRDWRTLPTTQRDRVNTIWENDVFEKWTQTQQYSDHIAETIRVSPHLTTEEANTVTEDAFKAGSLLSKTTRADLKRVVDSENVQQVASAFGWQNTGNANSTVTYVAPQDNIQPFVEERTDIEQAPDWHPKLAIGRGSFGVGLLWLKTTHDENIIERKVARLTQTVDLQDVSNPAGPHEVRLNRKASGPRNPYILRFRGWSTTTNDGTGLWEPDDLNGIQPLWWLYTDYCPHGDLQDLRDLYDARNQPIPEIFIWYLVDCLAQACLVLEQGGVQAADPNWGSQIVHRDFKCENVFLGPERDGVFCKYPVPVLADFGLALETFPTDPHNPHGYRRPPGRAGVPPAAMNELVGTLGYLAPEQALGPTRMLAHTNIWAIGLIVWLLQRPSVDAPDLDYFAGDTEPDRNIPREGPYGTTLDNLAYDCMQLNAALRPTPAQLRARVQPHLDRVRRDVTTERRTLPPLGFQPERYGVGTRAEPKYPRGAREEYNVRPRR